MKKFEEVKIELIKKVARDVFGYELEPTVTVESLSGKFYLYKLELERVVSCPGRVYYLTYDILAQLAEGLVTKNINVMSAKRETVWCSEGT